MGDAGIVDEYVDRTDLRNDRGDPGEAGGVVGNAEGEGLDARLGGKLGGALAVSAIGRGNLCAGRLQGAASRGSATRPSSPAIDPAP
jgi:hypothetical protein